MAKKLFQTLRFRLTLWNTIVVLIASLVALIAVRVAMRITIENETRELLQEESIELALEIAKLYPNQKRINEEFGRKIFSHSQHEWFAALLNERGQFVWKSDHFPDSWEVGGINPTDSTPAFVFKRTHDWLLVAHTIHAPAGQRFQILLGEPIQFIRNDVWKLTKIMLMIGAGLLVVAPIGGYFLARNATRPVQKIIATTRSLNPAQLDSRLEIRGTGDELDQISSEINSFVDQISKYIKGQREFVANAAHELRSPITAIQTSVEVTLGRQRTLAEYQEELETVSEQCQQLRHLVNQLLELAETDTSNPTTTLQVVNFSQLIEKSVNIFSGVAEEKRIAVIGKLEPDVEIRSDETKLRQIVNNLLDNALKFSPPGGRVDVELGRTSAHVIFRVRDTGPGVPEDFLDRIFDRFFQLDASRERDGRRGNGLGLSICRSSAQHLGGRIQATNGARGLVIEVQFPR